MKKNAKQKVDVVITAGRYSAADESVLLVQAYERTGPVWSDIRVYDRRSLVEMLEAGKQVATGRPGKQAGDFVILSEVRLVSGKLVVHGRLGGGEVLGVPRF